MLAKLINGSSPTSGAGALSGSLIAVEGMFNVNSTSLEAWKAMLSSLRTRTIEGQTNGGDTQISSSSITTPNVGLFNPSKAKVTTDKGSLDEETLNAQWSGIHMLSDTEIAALAKAIVSEVRKRGPFLSLADFVNRRVGTDKTLALSGAIQSALDSDDVTINKPFRTGNRAATGVEPGLVFPEAERGAAAYGIPGYVKQADILTPIAPLLSARSDTFVIRACGAKTNSAGTTVIAKAYCEAVVQRSPNYVDSSQDMNTPAAGTINTTHGRRFEIVSFRWLSSSEI